MSDYKLAAFLLGLACTAPAAALDDTGPELLLPDQAFAFSAVARDDATLQVTWKIADGYYLYRDRIRFSTDTPGMELGTPELPQGKIKDDEFFGKLAIFRNEVTANIPFRRTANAPDRIRLQAVSQGCADIGVCYPPHTQHAELALPAAATGVSAREVTDTLEALDTLSGRLGLDTGADAFLDPDAAFQTSVDVLTPDRLLVRWDIADGYYLYRDKLRIRLVEADGISLGSFELPAGETRHDEFFGDVQILHRTIETRVPLRRAAGEAREIKVELGYQGCAEAGICYPPIKKIFPVALAAVPTDGIDAPTGAATTAPAAVTSKQDAIVRVLQESSPGWIILFFFGAGVLLAFTACMYPMIPIISSIIVGHGENITAGKAFSLSLIYVEAVAVTYALIGLVSAQLGAGVQAFFQNPWILGLFALVFVVLALSMFGFYNLQLPASWQARLSEASNRQRGGSIAGVALMGVLSALIVGPCAGPVLIGALLYTSQTADYLTGALAMFALGNGMGAPLLEIGTSGGKLLPRAGAWMDSIKAVFGVVLLGVAILMLERILPGPVTLVLWALLLIIPAIYLRALDALPETASGWQRLWKGLGLVMLIYGIILILGASTGARDPLNPLRNITRTVSVSGNSEPAAAQPAFRRIKSIADLEAALQESSTLGKPAMLDFYADWCTYCVKMEDYTFSDDRVRQALAGITLLQADVTASDTVDLALLNHFSLFAPPAILFFDPDGQERRNYRLVGFMDADDFLGHLEGATGR